jgi:hypothetical protein
MTKSALVTLLLLPCATHAWLAPTSRWADIPNRRQVTNDRVVTRTSRVMLARDPAAYDDLMNRASSAQGEEAQGLATAMFGEQQLAFDPFEEEEAAAAAPSAADEQPVKLGYAAKLRAAKEEQHGGDRLAS